MQRANGASAAARAAQNVVAEGVLVQGGPVEALAFGLHGPSQRRWRWCRFDGGRSSDEGPKRRVRCVDSMKAGEVALGPRAPYRANRSSPSLSLACTTVSACNENPSATATRLRRLGKVPVVTRNTHDFVCNRLKDVANLAQEGQQLLDAGVVTRESDIDVLLVAGCKYPRHEGGPMFARAAAK